MIVELPNTLLYMHPKLSPNEMNPVIDELTIKMFNALCNASARGTFSCDGKFTFQEGFRYKGIHVSIGGYKSSTCEYRLKNGLITNYLCAHYLMHHRDEVSESDLNKVRSLKESTALTEERQEQFKNYLSAIKF